MMKSKLIFDTYTKFSFIQYWIQIHILFFYLTIIYRYFFSILLVIKSKQHNCILFHRSYECEMKYIVSIIKIFAFHIQIRYILLLTKWDIHLQVHLVLQSYFMFKLLIQILLEISKSSTINRLKEQLIYDAQIYPRFVNNK